MQDDPSFIRRQTQLFEQLSAEPWAHDFFAVLRRFESLWRHQPRLGKAVRPSAEPVRLGQDAELDFAPAALMSFTATNDKPPRIGTRHLGLFGPMGALPLHLTEYTRDRQRNHGDATLARFADVFHHRALLLFYRAWAQTQPAVQADRPGDDQFAKWVSALFGQAPAAFEEAHAAPNAVPDDARRFMAGHLSRAARNVESIEKALRSYFRVPVRVESHVGHWMHIRPEDRTRLGGPAHRHSTALGRSAVAGAKVWDRQYKLRLHLGPLTLAQYESFLPGQAALAQLRGWMHQLLGIGMQWDVRLVLKGAEVPRLGFGTRTPLGRTTWLGCKPARSDRDRGDLRISTDCRAAGLFDYGRLNSSNKASNS